MTTQEQGTRWPTIVVIGRIRRNILVMRKTGAQKGSRCMGSDRRDSIDSLAWRPSSIASGKVPDTILANGMNCSHCRKGLPTSGSRTAMHGFAWLFRDRQRYHLGR